MQDDKITFPTFMREQFPEISAAEAEKILLSDAPCMHFLPPMQDKFPEVSAAEIKKMLVERCACLPVAGRDGADNAAVYQLKAGMEPLAVSGTDVILCRVWRSFARER